MRSFNTRGAQAQVRLENFTGLQYRAPAKETSAAYDLCNLRRMSDGTLSRREGFSPIATLPNTVRGVFDSVQDGVQVLYAAAGHYVYAIREVLGNYIWKQIGELQSYDGEVSFFLLDGNVILMDGIQMYGLFPDSAEVLIPYIPLYGKDWTSDNYGTVYEGRNVLTDQIHIRYITSAYGASLNLRISPERVDAVYINGALVEAQNYTHNPNANTLTFTNMMGEGQTVDVLMTMPKDGEAQALREDFRRCRCGLRPGEAGRTVALFGVGNETGVLYLTREIAKEDRKRCRAIQPHANMLYLQQDGRMEIGDGLHGVTAMVRHYDRTLVMTQRGTWTAQAQHLVAGATGAVFGMINSQRGCSTRQGAISFGNTPVSVCGGDILLWSADTDALDECNASIISEAVKVLLPDAFGETGRVVPNLEKNEVWCYLPDGTARVFVWQQAYRSWTSYDFGSFAPSCLFVCGDGIGLASGKTIFCSVGEAICDTDAQGEAQPILCSYVSHRQDFGHKGQTLRPYEILTCVDADAGSEITVTLETADGAQAYVTLLATGEQPYEAQKRISAGRCRHAMVRVDCAARGAFTLRAVGVAAGL